MTHPRINPVIKLLVAAFAVLGLLGGGSAVIAPAATAAVAQACEVNGCDEARSSNEIWASLNYPSERGWVDWPDGQCNFAGGTYNNYEGQLPEGHSYLEFDVTPHECGAQRQAYRLVLDTTTNEVYFSPDHYGTFHLL